MNENFTNQDLPELPFPGINPYHYSNRDIFFARNEERKQLIRLIVMYRAVLLYSASGVGKSSLINAALIPDAINEGFTPELIKVQPIPGEEIIIQLIETVSGSGIHLPSMFAPEREEKRIILSTEQFKEIIYQNTQQFHPLLIFDQFEEWVTLFTSAQESSGIESAREKILQTIIALIKDTNLAVKVLLVFREDYIAELTPFFKLYPNLVDQYLRLRPIEAKQIYKVIRCPFELNKKYPAEISPGLAGAIQSQFEERSQKNAIQLTEVQIVALGLYSASLEGKDPEKMFNELGITGLIEEYSKKYLEVFSPEEQEVAVALLSRMVTQAGTRNIISKDNLLSLVEMQEGIDKKLLSAVLDKLEGKTPFIRRERRRQVYYYEIASEFLIKWIFSKAKEHERKIIERNEKIRLEKELIEERSRNRRKIRIFAGIIILAGLIGVVVLIQYLKFREQKSLSDARELAAISNSFLQIDPEKSLIWALQSVLTTIESDTVTSEAEDALHKALMESRSKLAIKDSAGFFKSQFSFDAQQLISRSYNNVIAIWDAQSGRLEKELPGNNSKVVDFSINPAEPKAAVLDSSGIVRIWNTGNYKMEKEFRCTEAGGYLIQYSLTGKYLATIDMESTIKVWDTKNWKLFREFYARFNILSSPNYPRVAFNSNDSLIAVSGLAYTDPYYDIVIYELKSGDLLKTLIGHSFEIYSLAFNAKSDLLASGSRDMTTKLWDCSEDKSYLLPFSTFNSTNSIFTVSFSRDGGKLLSGGANRSAKVWSIQEPSYERKNFEIMELFTLKGHNGFINYSEFSPEGTRVVTAGEDGKIEIWSAQQNKEYLIMGEPNEKIYDLEYSPDSVFLAAALNNKVNLWNSVDGNFYKEKVLSPGFYVKNIAFNNNGSKIAISSTSGKAFIWDLPTDSLITIRGKFAAFSSDSKMIAAADSDNTLIIWDPKGALIRKLKFLKNGIRSISFNPLNNMQIAAAYDSGIIIQDISKEKSRLIFQMNSGQANSVAFSPDGKLLAAGGNKGIITIWDAGKGIKLAELIGHTDQVWDLCFNHKGKKLASASSDLTSKIWDAVNFRKLSTFTGSGKWVRSVSFSMNDSKLAAAGEDGFIRIYSLKLQDLINSAVNRVSNSLDSADYKRHLNVNDLPESMIALDLFIRGKYSSMQGDTLSAVKNFKKAKGLENRLFNFDPITEAKKIYAETLFEKVEMLIKNSRIKEAAVIFKKIRKINPKYKIDKIELQNLLNTGIDNAKIGEVETAINIFSGINEIDSSFISATNWNNLCWYGSLWGKGYKKELLEAAEKAVALEPLNPYLIDTRGFAKTINNDLKGAAKDFKFFIKQASDNTQIKVRKEWVALLEKGKNPFSKKYLEYFRNEELKSSY